MDLKYESPIGKPIETVADLMNRLGHIPLERIRCCPAPGSAMPRDILTERYKHDRLCELVEGVLVEKALGLRESWFAGFIVNSLFQFEGRRRLGVVTGAACPMAIL